MTSNRTCASGTNTPGRWGVGKVPSGKVVAEVLQANGINEGRFQPGDVVKVGAGWRTFTWVSDTSASGMGGVELLDRSVPPQIYLGLAGSGGRSAQLPLKHVARPKPGETAFVTAVSGCVGPVACQLMVLDGVRVVGSCGSEEKVELLEGLGVRALDYNTAEKEEGGLPAALRRLVPDGVDFLFDNVAGEIRLAILEAMNEGGHTLTSGMIAMYDGQKVGSGATQESAGEAGEAGVQKREAELIRGKKLADHGQFYVGNWESEFEDCTKDIVELYAAKKLVSKDAVVEGFEKPGEAFCVIFSGKIVGRMVVKV